MKIIFFFVAAATFNGVTWFATMAAKAGGVPPYLELIQLGGTGGLIISLVLAVLALWKERKELKDNWNNDVTKLQNVISTERTDHRDEIKDMREQHQKDLQKLTTKYTDELKEQINLLRNETDNIVQRERQRVEDQFKKKPGA